jgi:pantoate--beta-alanine ligase
MTAPADFPKTGKASTAAPELASTVDEVRERIAAFRRQTGTAVGLVPTMGFFHEGHLSLMRAARSDCGFVVVSIFVNPAQFGPDEDLAAYPRDLDRDLELAAAAGVDLVFIPGREEIYPAGYDTFVEPGKAAQGLCGQNRPGHFRGVATVVAKLFNIVRPNRAYFGQKDAQQAAVVKRLAADLDFGIQVRICPTVREPDGLAMSSRNLYLTGEERAQALVLFQALNAAGEAVARGETDATSIRRIMRRTIGQNFLVELEYARVVDPETMEPIAVVDREALAAVAARVGKARLIDNLMISQ